MVDAVKKMLGKEGTKVKLTMRRQGQEGVTEYEITRGRVESETPGGVVGDNADKSCQWHYRSLYEGTESEAPSAD